MSGVKHTPGPWEHWGDLVSVAAPRIGAGNIICVEPPTERSAANWPANACLIAAAPDLEQDGSFLLDRLDEFASEFQDDDVARQFYGHVSPAMARFRAAIARARGEQSPNHSDQKEVGNG